MLVIKQDKLITIKRQLKKLILYKKSFNKFIKFFNILK